ncbi:MAG: hypothetical protein AAFZ87_00400 [Planctomycetota bacterium]
MKYTQRLDYGRLAEVLHERGLANLDAIRELLQLSQDGGMPFCEALVTSNLVSDWDLSKVVCETFQLPFLPVDLIEPNPAALEEIDQALFRKHQLVPVDLFGQVLTVAMPSLVPAEVLAQVAAMTDFVVLPLVGTVESNRRWIADKMAAAAGPSPDVEGGWESMFDAADAEVAESSTGAGDAGLSVLDDPLFGAEAEDALAPADGSLDLTGDEALELPITDELDLGAIEALPADDLEIDPITETSANGAGGLPELPPMPEFNPDQREAG